MNDSTSAKSKQANPWVALGEAEIPFSNNTLSLRRRHSKPIPEFSICISGVPGELMNSRLYNSEQKLAELSCAHIKKKDNAHVLVGGLGMGYTLASALDAVSTSSTVSVAELIPEVVEWNKGELGECAGHPLQDPRAVVHNGDVAQCFNDKSMRYDAIMLDVDNGPDGLTHIDNDWLYSLEGLGVMKKSLQDKGVLSIWSANPDTKFVARLKKVGFKVDVKTVRARPGKGSKHTIFMAFK